MIITNVIYLFFFFSSRRRHTRSLRDWSSDVCSSDLERIAGRTQKPSSCVVEAVRHLLRRRTLKIALLGAGLAAGFRSEERRVGKGCRSRWSLVFCIIML